jgi:hypothetical protein
MKFKTLLQNLFLVDVAPKVLARPPPRLPSAVPELQNSLIHHTARTSHHVTSGSSQRLSDSWIATAFGRREPVSRVSKILHNIRRAEFNLVFDEWKRRFHECMDRGHLLRFLKMLEI